MSFSTYDPGSMSPFRSVLCSLSRLCRVLHMWCKVQICHWVFTLYVITMRFLEQIGNLRNTWFETSRVRLQGIREWLISHFISLNICSIHCSHSSCVTTCSFRLFNSFFKIDTLKLKVCRPQIAFSLFCFQSREVFSSEFWTRGLGQNTFDPS